MPDTRSGKTASKPLSEAEIETIQAKLDRKDERLREEAALLKQQREEYEKNVQDFIKYREQMEKDIEMHKAGAAADETPQTANEDVLREIELMRRELERLRRENRSTPRHSGEGLPARNLQEHQYDLSFGPTHLPKVSFREATDSVPYFDGYNIPLSQFNKACRRAKEIIPVSAERNLTKLLINKLRGRAYSAVEDEPCDDITQLIDLLTAAFGSRKTIDQHRGELSMIYLKPYEHIIDYISRVKELRAAILDAERRETGTILKEVETEVNTLTGRSFCKGLPLEYRLQMKESLYYKPFEAFSVAKTIAKEQELDRNRFGARDRQDRAYPQRQLATPAPPRERYNDVRPNRADQTQAARSDYHRANYSRYEHPRPERSQNNYARAEYSRNSNQQQERPRNNYPHVKPPPEHNNRSIRTIRDPSSGVTGPPNANQEVKQCKYCKNFGHEISECRKREYNNARRNHSENSQGPARPMGDARQGPPIHITRPVNPVDVIPAESIE